MTVLNTGSTKKYSANWDSIFAGAGRGKSAAKKTRPAAKKKATKKAKK